ncbi:MAG: hypothetical protein M3R16_06455 [Pseudomonadota bacterium]|nr:hypothetical protein [Pseudomonadota bacterium]
MNRSKGYDLIIERRALYLFAKVSGPHDTLQISIDYWTEIAEECFRASADRLLVLEELAEKSAAVDMAQMIRLLPQMGFKDMRIAFVDPKEDLTMLVFAEVRAMEVGLTGHVFGVVEAAERWLLSDIGQAGDLRRGSTPRKLPPARPNPSQSPTAPQ